MPACCLPPPHQMLAAPVSTPAASAPLPTPLTLLAARTGGAPGGGVVFPENSTREARPRRRPAPSGCRGGGGAPRQGLAGGEGLLIHSTLHSFHSLSSPGATTAGRAHSHQQQASATLSRTCGSRRLRLA